MGLAIREPSWRSFRILCPWSIALILEVIIRFEMNEAAGTSVTLSPARVLNALLEVLSRGFRFPVPGEQPDNKPNPEDVNAIHDLIASAKRTRADSKRYTHKLVDPCEAGSDYDALGHITSQRKNDIRACAKYALDLIQRNQICLLLNTPRVDGLENMNKCTAGRP